MTRVACVLALVLTLVPGLAAAAPEERHLEVVFLPDGEGPALWLEVTSTVEQGRTRRAARVAWLSGEQQISRAFGDTVQGTPLLGLYPEAPADVPLEVTADGSLLLTLPAPEGWQDRLAPPDPRKASPDAPAVALARSARLLLAAPAAGVPEEGAMVGASLHGTERSLEGKAWLRRASSPAETEIVVDVGGELRVMTLAGRGGTSVFVADVLGACNRALPRVVLFPGAPAAFRLVSEARAACLEGELAVARMGGVQLTPRGEAPVRGLVVSRPRT